MARSHGCEAVPRDPHFASSEVSMSGVYEYMAMQCDADVIAYANCTSPLVRDRTIESLIDEFLGQSRDFDSLNTASLVREFLFYNNRPINYDLQHQPRSQDLPEIAALNFAVNILERGTMISCKNVVGRQPRLRIIDEVEALDIDTPLDFAIAEHIFIQRGGIAHLTS
jgi:N-acylneuraminate cytidylyltransferase